MELVLPKSNNTAENKKLFEQLNSGNLSIRNKIIEKNLRLVEMTIQKKLPDFSDLPYMDKEDLFEIGCIGLIKAVDSYDLDRGKAFSAYAVICIRNEILMYYRKNKKLSLIDSLNENVSEEDERSKVELLVSNEESIEDKYIQKETSIEMLEHLSCLTEIEKKAVKLYYGFGERRFTDREIAQELGYSQSYISRILKKARHKLKDLLENKSFNEIVQEEYSFEVSDAFALFSEYPRAKVIRTIKKLPKAKRKLFLDCYPINGKYGLTFKEVCQKYNLSSKVLLRKLDKIKEEILFLIIQDQRKTRQVDIFKQLPDYPKEKVLEAIHMLEEPNQTIFTLRYGIDRKDQLSVEEIVSKLEGKELDIPLTPESVIKNLFVSRQTIKRLVQQGNGIKIKTNFLNSEELFFSNFPGYSKEQVLSLFPNLLERRRIIVELCFGLNGNETKSIKEIAIMMGCSQKEVKQRVEYVIKVLNKQLKDRYKEPEDSKVLTKKKVEKR